MADPLTILFRDVLQFPIGAYPGGFFSGNPVQDLLQYFFLPTVLIIFFIHILLGRIGLGEHGHMRILMGIAVFVFVVIEKWFAAFAGSTEFYFLILLLIGIVYFVMGHFTRRDQQQPQNFPSVEHKGGNMLAFPERRKIAWHEREEYIKKLKARLKNLDDKIEKMAEGGATVPNELFARRDALEDEIEDLERSFFERFRKAA